MLKSLIKKKAKAAIKELLQEAMKTAKDAEYSMGATKDGKFEIKVKFNKEF